MNFGWLLLSHLALVSWSRFRLLFLTGHYRIPCLGWREKSKINSAVSSSFSLRFVGNRWFRWKLEVGRVFCVCVSECLFRWKFLQYFRNHHHGIVIKFNSLNSHKKHTRFPHKCCLSLVTCNTLELSETSKKTLKPSVIWWQLEKFAICDSQKFNVNLDTIAVTSTRSFIHYNCHLRRDWTSKLRSYTHHVKLIFFELLQVVSANLWLFISNNDNLQTRTSEVFLSVNCILRDQRTRNMF